MRNSVVTACRGQGVRLRERQFRIEDSRAEEDLGISGGHLNGGSVGTRFGIDNCHVALRFTSRAGRGGYRDHRKQRSGYIAVAPIVAQGTAIRDDDVDGLGEIEGTAATQSDDEIDVVGSGVFARGIDRGAGGSLL